MAVMGSLMMPWLGELVAGWGAGLLGEGRGAAGAAAVEEVADVADGEPARGAVEAGWPLRAASSWAALDCAATDWAARPRAASAAADSEACGLAAAVGAGDWLVWTGGGAATAVLVEGAGAGWVCEGPAEPLWPEPGCGVLLWLAVG